MKDEKEHSYQLENAVPTVVVVGANLSQYIILMNPFGIVLVTPASPYAGSKMNLKGLPDEESWEITSRMK
eukprot:scaffold17225_cov79-Skeletonema_marinoi.AAC.2